MQSEAPETSVKRGAAVSRHLLVQKAAVSRAQHADVLWPLVLNFGELLENRLDRILLLHHLAEQYRVQ